jgi:hypothetical protein
MAAHTELSQSEEARLIVRKLRHERREFLDAVRGLQIPAIAQIVVEAGAAPRGQTAREFRQHGSNGRFHESNRSLSKFRPNSRQSR